MLFTEPSESTTLAPAAEVSTAGEASSPSPGPHSYTL